MFTVEIWTRNGLGLVPMPGQMELTPVSFGWAAVGGPKAAEIEARGTRASLVSLVGRLGYNLVIYGKGGGLPVWWGYIESVSLSLGEYSVSVSLEQSYNTVAAAYTYEDVDNTTQRGTTDWFSDASGLSRFGRKELLYSLPNAASVEDAETFAEGLASRLAIPVPVVQPGGGGGDIARITCRGLWDTIGWRYYKQDMGFEAHEESDTTQVLGVGLTSTNIVFGGPTRTVYNVGGLHGFKAGDNVTFSGTASNNYHKTIEEATQREPYLYTATTIDFEPSTDLWDEDEGFTGLEAGDWILISGSAANSGLKQIQSIEWGVERPGLGYGWDHIELQEAVSAEAAGPSVTIRREGNFKVAGGLVSEGPGVSATITGWGKKIAQSFALEFDTDDWPLYEVRLKLKKTGAPADSVRAALHSDSSGSPGALVESATLAAGLIGSTEAWETFAFTGLTDLTYGTTYWLVVDRVGADDAINYYEVGVDTEAGYVRGDLKLWDGASWGDRPTDASLAFQVVGKEDVGPKIARIINDTAERIATATAAQTYVYTTMHRDGDDNALDEVERLMKQGNEYGDRLVSRVADNRDVSIFPRPSNPGSSSMLVLRGDGRVLDKHGRPLLPGTPVAGEWMFLDEPGLAEFLESGLEFYVEEAEYDVERGRWTVTPENGPNPFDIAATRQG